MRFEVVFGRVLKTTLMLAGIYMVFALANSMRSLDCSLEAYPPAVLWAVFLGLLAFVLYSRFDLLSTGLLKRSPRFVRVILAAISVMELAFVASLAFKHESCSNIGGIIVIPGSLLFFYTCIVLAILFGDGYLGVVRNIVRLGRAPIGSE